MVMQGTYILKGKLGMYTSFAISLANSSGILEGGICYNVEGSGGDLKVTAFSNLRANGEEISYTISMKEAMAEGWTSNAKYKTLPELMLRYRAATLLIRTHIPEVLNGMHTVEELKDVEASKRPIKFKDVSSEEEAINSLDSYLDEEKVKDIEVEVIQDEAVLKKYFALQELIELHNVPQETVDLWLQKAQVESIDELPEEKIEACIDYVKNKKHLKNKN